MTPCEERGWKVGDLFVVIDDAQDCIEFFYKKGDVITLHGNGREINPEFTRNNRFSQFVPRTKVVAISDYFNDYHNPTVNERLMFKLNYGFDPYE